MLAILLFLAAAPDQCAVPAADIRQQLALGYDQFDTDGGKFGWRQLNARGCVDDALRLLDSYAKAHSTLPQAERSEMAFHAGQALAFNGRGREAIPHFERSLAIGGSDAWMTYVAANIAFLKGDTAGLRRARDRYAALSPKSMRLKALDGFIACPAKTYMEAAHCAM